MQVAVPGRSVRGGHTPRTETSDELSVLGRRLTCKHHHAQSELLQSAHSDLGTSLTCLELTALPQADRLTTLHLIRMQLRECMCVNAHLIGRSSSEGACAFCWTLKLVRRRPESRTISPEFGGNNPGAPDDDDGLFRTSCRSAVDFFFLQLELSS